MNLNSSETILLKVQKCSSNTNAGKLTVVWLNQYDYNLFQELNQPDNWNKEILKGKSSFFQYILCNNKCIFEYCLDDNIEKGNIGLSGVQRQILDVNIGD